MKHMCVMTTALMVSVSYSKAQQIPDDLDQARDFMLVKSEIANRLGDDYRSGVFKFDESRLDQEVLRSEYLYAKQKNYNPYQYPTVGQLFYKKADLYQYIANKIMDHTHWVTYASKFMYKFNVHEYDTFINFSSRPFSQLFGEFLESEKIEVKKWQDIDHQVRSNPVAYLLQGPHHPHKITGVDKLHQLGFNGEGTQTIVWDCGFVNNCHVNFTIKDDHVLNPKKKKDYDMNQLHGTHVSGIIAGDDKSGNFKGVAYNGSILPAEFRGVDDLFKRIKDSPAKVISASFHYLVDKLEIRDFDRLANELEKSDRLLVMASGNSHEFMDRENDPNFVRYWVRGVWMGTHAAWILNKNPKLANRVLLVGSLKEDGQTPSKFSNLAGMLPENFVFAPGENVKSTVAFDGFMKMSGTSMATPHVSGILTLMSKAYPTLNAIELKQCLLDSCDKFWEEQAVSQYVEYKPEIFGRGRVNAVNAFQLAEQLTNAKKSGTSSISMTQNSDHDIEMVA